MHAFLITIIKVNESAIRYFYHEVLAEKSGIYTGFLDQKAFYFGSKMISMKSKSRIAIETFKKIDELIVRRSTGKPAEMAVKVDCSLTTLFTYLAMMRKMGAPISYNKHKHTYYYEEEGRFVIGFEPK